MQLGIAELPLALPERPAEDEALLRSIHDLIMDVRMQIGRECALQSARRWESRLTTPMLCTAA